MVAATSLRQHRRASCTYATPLHRLPHQHMHKHTFYLNLELRLCRTMLVPAAVAVTLAISWPQVAWSKCDVCAVRYDHIKDFSTPFEEGMTHSTCKYYQDAACCSHDTVQQCVPLFLYPSMPSPHHMPTCLLQTIWFLRPTCNMSCRAHATAVPAWCEECLQDRKRVQHIRRCIQQGQYERMQRR